MKKEETVLERQEIEVDGEIIIIEKVKMDGVDDNGNSSCWKGYKKQGTKAKGGKHKSRLCGRIIAVVLA